MNDMNSAHDLASENRPNQSDSTPAIEADFAAIIGTKSDLRRKSYWTIGELSREFEITARTLRFYEDRGLISPQRIGQNRKYSARDRARLKLILRGKRVGLALDDVGKLLDLYDMEGGKEYQMHEALKVFHNQLDILLLRRIDIEESIDALKSQILRVETLLEKGEFTKDEYRKLEKPNKKD